MEKHATGRAGIMKMHPNNARLVIWAFVRILLLFDAN